MAFSSDNGRQDRQFGETPHERGNGYDRSCGYDCDYDYDYDYDYGCALSQTRQPKRKPLLLTLGSLVLVAAQISGCAEDSESNNQPPGPTQYPLSVANASEARWPYEVMTCPNTTANTTQSMTCGDYDAVAASVRGIYESLSAACTATDCQQADFAGCVLRVSGHDLMDYNNGEGGADGCLDFHDVDNMGLAGCLHKGEHGVSLLSAYQQHCGTVSLADFLVIAAETVMSLSRDHVLQADSSRGAVDFRAHFKFGRTTASECHWTEGRLPNPERSCTAVRETFVDRMGLSWASAAALMGVHTLGRARPENSGYNGFWSDMENSRRFNNNYYASMLGKGWMIERAVGGHTNKNQWRRSDPGANEANLGKEMMLDTDLCLAYAEENGGGLSAGTGNCRCAWLEAGPAQPTVTTYLGGRYCGQAFPPRGENAQRELCCDGERNENIDCGDPDTLAGPAAASVMQFANSESAWLTAFQTAWTQATENGFSGLQPLSQCTVLP